MDLKLSAASGIPHGGFKTVARRPSLRLRGLEHDVLTPDVETASPRYATRFEGGVGRYLLDTQEEAVLSLLEDRGGRPLRILEVGGGHAQLTPRLLNLGHHVTVQGSQGVCAARLTRLFQRHIDRLEFVASDLWTLPFEDREFDVVIGLRLLAHVERAPELLTEMARVSRWAVIVDYPPRFSANLVEPLLFSLKRRLEGNTRPFFCYGADKLRGPLEAAGLTRFQTTRQFLLPMVVHRQVSRPEVSRRLEQVTRRLGLTHLLGAPAILRAERGPGLGDGEQPDDRPSLVASPSPLLELELKRVLLVAPQPFFRVTGTPINILLMCRALTKNGFGVDLVTLPYGRHVDLPGLQIIRTARLPGVHDVKIGFSAPKLLYNGLLSALVAWRLCTRRYHAIHAVEEAAFYAAPLGRLVGVPVVTDLDSDLCRQLRESGSRLASGLSGLAATLRRVALRSSDVALTVATRMSEIVRIESPATAVCEIRDIPMPEAIRPPDPKAVSSLSEELGLRGRRAIVYTGNFDRRQGLEELIHAMPEVLRHHPNAVLLLVGGDPKRSADLTRLVRDLDLDRAVRLVGPRPPETMPEIMALAEVLASPRLEPYATPLKVFSYMASGTPIVATDLPTHTDVLDRDSAVLVAPTPEGLASGIVGVLNDPLVAAEFGEQARSRVRRDHTFEQFESELVGIYTDLLSDRSACRAASRSGPASEPVAS